MALPPAEHVIPPPGRVLDSDEGQFDQRAVAQVSLAQGLKWSQEHEGKDFLWTTDLETELPIKMLNSSVDAAAPATTLIEAFAKTVELYADVPALAAKPMTVSSWPHIELSPLRSGAASPLRRKFDGNASPIAGGPQSSAELSFSPRRRASVAELMESGLSPNAAERRKSVLATQRALGAQVESVDENWRILTWREYHDQVCSFAKSCIEVGMLPRDRVAIMGFNAPEWAIAHFGTIFANGVSASIYVTNNLEATSYIVSNAECKVAICDTIENLSKFVHAKRSRTCPNLSHIVIYGEALPADIAAQEDLTVLHWDDFMKLGVGVGELKLSERMNQQRAGMCCTLIYTSGTTALPKGVMLSHDNLTWTAALVAKTMSFGGSDVLVSFLPLSHVAPQMIDLVLPVCSGVTTYFAQPDALKGSLLKTLQEVRPTWFFAVPRVWEKIEERIRSKAGALSGMRRKIFDYACDVGLEGMNNMLEGRSTGMMYSVARELVLKKIRKEIGFDRCKAFGTGAAPIARTTHEYFMSLGMPICDIFGMSECSGPQSVNLPFQGRFRLGTAGTTFPATEMKIKDPDADGNGEICLRGRNVCMGYYKNEEATKKTMDKDGFLLSGDVGKMDADGFLTITGRIKEILVTSGGENVPPTAIEEVVKSEMPFVSNCQVIGDQRKFLSVLLCLKTVLDSDGQPTSALSEEVIDIFAAEGSRARSTLAAANDEVVHYLVDEALERVNEKAISRAQRLQDFIILPQDFSLKGGELTPTLKLKRNVVISKYSKLIDELYEKADLFVKKSRAPQPPITEGNENEEDHQNEDSLSKMASGSSPIGVEALDFQENNLSTARSKRKKSTSSSPKKSGSRSPLSSKSGVLGRLSGSLKRGGDKTPTPVRTAAE